MGILDKIPGKSQPSRQWIGEECEACGEGVRWQDIWGQFWCCVCSPPETDALVDHFEVLTPDGWEDCSKKPSDPEDLAPWERLTPEQNREVWGYNDQLFNIGGGAYCFFCHSRDVREDWFKHAVICRDCGRFVRCA